MTPRQRPLKNTSDLPTTPPLHINAAGSALWTEGFTECRRYVLTERLALAQALSVLERIAKSSDSPSEHLAQLASAAARQVKNIREEGYGKRPT